MPSNPRQRSEPSMEANGPALLSELAVSQREIRNEQLIQGKDIAYIKGVVHALPAQVQALSTSLHDHKAVDEARFSRLETSTSMFQGTVGHILKGSVLLACGSAIAAAFKFILSM